MDSMERKKRVVQNGAVVHFVLQIARARFVVAP